MRLPAVKWAARTDRIELCSKIRRLHRTIPDLTANQNVEHLKRG